MAVIDYDKKEVNAKIVYYGPGLSGKTSNIHYINSKLMTEHRGELMTLSTKSHRTLFFDFLPVELGEIKGLNTRFYLYTVPGQVFYNNIRKEILKDVDGIVFVADSQAKMKNENIQSFHNLEENLAEQGKSLKDIPHVLQYNKRDMPELQSLEDLHRQLNKYNAPFFESMAMTGQGVLKTLTTISKMVLKRLREASTLQAKTYSGGPAEAYGLSDEFIAMTTEEAKKMKAEFDKKPAPPEAAPPRPEAPRPAAPQPPPAPPAAPVKAPLPAKVPAPPPPAKPLAPPPPAKPAPPPSPPAPVPKAAAAPGSRPAPVPPAPVKPRPPAAPPPAPPVPVPAAVKPPKPAPATTPPKPGPSLAPPPPPPPIVAPPVPLPVLPLVMAPPAPPRAGGQLVVARWGNPQAAAGGILKLPVVFKDQATGKEYSTSITIQMMPLVPAK